MSKIIQVAGRGISVRGDDIDTDRIIPARFLKTVSFENLANSAFYDERASEKEKGRTHPFDQERFKGASILIVNRNFGCGSSREHAPQALKSFGIKAIVGESFAEIFAGNCSLIGVPTVRLSREEANELQEAVEEDPNAMITINLEEKLLDCEDISFNIEMPENVRRNFVEGTWDTTSQLVEAADRTRQLSQRLPYISGFK